jgi:hypothetical protein
MSNWKKRDKKQTAKQRNADWLAGLPSRQAAAVAYRATLNGPVAEVRVLHEGHVPACEGGLWFTGDTAEMQVQVRLKDLTEWREIARVTDLDSARVQMKVCLTQTFFEARCLGRTFEEVLASLQRYYRYCEIKAANP